MKGFKKHMTIPVIYFIITVAAAGVACFLSIQDSKVKQDTINSIIGGDSYAYLTFGRIDQFKDEIYQTRLRINIEGKYPMYDVKISVNEDEYEPSLVGQKISPNIAITRWPTYDYGNLSRGEEIGVVNFGEKKLKTIYVDINSRNTMITETMKLKKDNSGKWRKAIIVWRVEKDGPKKLFEEVEPGFPWGAGGIWSND